ncbi:pyridoxamine 5'-phosphate oxidase family protein [Microcoleus sp. B3-A4]|uniref:pyridoxamine 5'-phosphate oxidase family protein n=1 Tax=Microcoleus sp. B3-A4 TaxID=2818653 RepID=UPI002FD6FA63
MLDIDEMSSKEIQELLQQVRHAHFGCVFEGHPYVLPMHYYLEDSHIYIFTTVGMKTKYIDTNPEVCLQVEEVRDMEHWRRVVVNRRAERLTQEEDIDRAMQLVKEHNPALSPAINRAWIDSPGRAEVIAIYRIHPSEMSGRTTEGISSR